MDKNKNLRINEEIDRFEEKKKEEGKDAKVNLNDISDKSAERETYACNGSCQRWQHQFSHQEH